MNWTMRVGRKTMLDIFLEIRKNSYPFVHSNVPRLITNGIWGLELEFFGFTLWLTLVAV